MYELLNDLILSPVAAVGFALTGYSLCLLALWLLSLVAAFFWPDEAE